MTHHFEPSKKPAKYPRTGTTSGSGGAEYFEPPANFGGGGGGGDVPLEEGLEPGLEGTEAGADNPVRGED